MYVYKIVQDDYCSESPRDWDNLGTMLCFHKRYTLGDKTKLYVGDFYSWKNVEMYIKSLNGIYLPIYMYEHGSITLSTKPFTCPWDSGQVGYIYVSKEKALKEYGKARLSKKLVDKIKLVLENEVNTYNKFLNNEVYGYLVENDKGDVVDSCFGYYDAITCESDAKEAIKHLTKRK